MDDDLKRRIREKIAYIRAHRKAIRDVARELTGSVPGYLRHHDMDKIRLLRQGMDPKEVSRIHRAHSPHHPGSDAETPNYDEMIFDWESARRTKPDKQLNAYETMMAYHPGLRDVLLPRMRELGLAKDASGMSGAGYWRSSQGARGSRRTGLPLVRPSWPCRCGSRKRPSPKGGGLFFTCRA